ncbi:type IV pili methyl-accepting chemotaxis transducer N-terminal domain-containing protein [Pseudomonas sp. Gutcm_11s]|uniref:type IV pili methyl-accepting chemotaxis transducer N-terminal domain-containing protein n=1 Tax=Pseudomonas sp. Gutcm_11s TaxID=3026088 RepID=UPI0023607A84|nr:type IV pili methyl-accepting chemotaxis transducer N-terminal domain-containing protein [Pseudomonas sp. Gutcm_11s]MDD0845110.1 type IV pili methyl-accepting chemotaxis transducer N-terminal domain-containing protein [Pseudomonas sp. Gutcm_11s]
MFKNCLSALLMITALVLSGPASAQLSAGEAMNMTGLQRSLVQRMAKNYLMIGADVRVDSASRQLQESVTQFDNAYQALSAYAPTPEIKSKLAEVGQTWETFRPQVTAKPDQAQAAAMLANSESLLKQSQELTDLMAAQVGAMGNVVNRSGWARVQSQRIAMLYMAKAWQVQAPDLDSKLDTAVADFDGILKEFEAKPAANEQIATSLRRVRANWAFTLKGIDLHATSAFVPTSITVSTDSLFRHMNELTRLYAGLQG